MWNEYYLKATIVVRVRWSLRTINNLKMCGESLVPLKCQMGAVPITKARD